MLCDQGVHRVTGAGSLLRAWPECQALPLKGKSAGDVDRVPEVSLGAYLSIVMNVRFNQLTPFERQLCVALGSVGGGAGVLCVTD